MVKNEPVKLSYSSVKTFKQCPRKFYLSQKWRSKAIPSALPFGNAVEAGVTELLKGKKLEEACLAFEKAWETENQRGVPRAIWDNPMVEFYASDFDEDLVDDKTLKLFEKWRLELLPDDDSTWGEVFDRVKEELKGDKRPNLLELKLYNRIMWECSRIRGCIMIKAFHDKILPDIEEVVIVEGEPAIQKKIQMTNEQGDQITAYPDFVVRIKGYDKPIILDLKTAARFYDNHTLNTSEQLKTYDAALMEELDHPLAGYCVLLKSIKVLKKCDNCGAYRVGLSKNCKECSKGKYVVPELDGEVQLMVKSFEEVELEEIMEEYQSVATAVKAGVDYKNPDSCMKFGRPCEFYEHCWGRKQLEKMKDIEKKEN